MREIAEFRVAERFAPMLFSESEGRRLGDSVRKIEIDTNDPRFRRIGELQARLLHSKGKPFFYGWKLKRKPTPKELEAAQLLRLIIDAVFEPPGEACGTKYDESAGCPRCGAGAKQVGPLFLDVTRLPKGKDFAATIVGEIVVSDRVSELFARHGITGAEFPPVRALNARPSDWRHMVIPTAKAEIVAPTRVGNDPFDDDPRNEYRCPEGHLIGLNLLSEVFVSSSSRGENDIIASRQFIGVRRGFLRPERVTLISPRTWQLISLGKLKGCNVEVAHLR